MPEIFTSARRFAVVGCSATAVHVAVVVGLVESGVASPLVANLAAFCLALLVSYLGNHRWTFEAAGRHGTHFPRFAAVAVLGLTLNQAILYAATERFGLAYGIGLAIVVVVVPAITFLTSRLWAFEATPTAAAWKK